MKKIWVALVGLLALTGCREYIPPGYVGIIVDKYGSKKGVEDKVQGAGAVWVGFYEQLYQFPIFQQTYNWTASPHEGSEHDEHMDFQSKESMKIDADVGVTYHLQTDKVPHIFQKYREGVQEITSSVMRNNVRTALNDVAATMTVDEIMSSGKEKLLADATTNVKAILDPDGIMVDRLFLLGAPRPPEGFTAAVNEKMKATQLAQQRENEVRQAEAEARKQVAEARGKAEATLTQAKADAESNRLKQASITDSLIRYEAVQKWNGKLPDVTGGNTPFINVGAGK